MTHIHTEDCIEEDVIDLGDQDDGLGYQTEDFYICRVTGEEHPTKEEFEIKA